MHLKTKPQNTLRKSDNTERRNRQFNSNSWSLQYYTFNRITKQKISKKTEVLSSTTNQLHLTNILSPPNNSRIHMGHFSKRQ